MNNKDKRRRELKRKFLRENLEKAGFFSDEIPMWKQGVAALILVVFGTVSIVWIGTFIGWLITALI